MREVGVADRVTHTGPDYTHGVPGAPSDRGAFLPVPHKVFTRLSDMSGAPAPSWGGFIFFSFTYHFECKWFSGMVVTYEQKTTSVLLELTEGGWCFSQAFSRDRVSVHIIRLCLYWFSGRIFPLFFKKTCLSMPSAFVLNELWWTCKAEWWTLAGLSHCSSLLDDEQTAAHGSTAPHWN